MIDMFTNYQNLSDYYVPNNLSKHICTPTSYTSKLDPIEASKPYELYDAKGRLEGYFWNYGESINLEFEVSGEITVENDAIIYTNAGEAPDIYTAGSIGQKLYNISDLKLWKLADIVGDSYIWKEVEFSNPEFGSDIYIDAEDYLKDKLATFRIYNFRYEVIFEQVIPAKTSILISLDADKSKEFKKGVYYCSLEISDYDLTDVIFSPSDCKLLVK